MAFVAITVLLLTMTTGLLPDARAERMKGRLSLCEAIAISVSKYDLKQDGKRMADAIHSIYRRNDDIASAAVRRSDGSLLGEFGEHQSHWDESAAQNGASDCVIVPIVTASNEPWGVIEIRFNAMEAFSWKSFYTHPYFRMMLFFPAVFLLLAFWYLSKMLNQMDPTKSVPSRVRSALNTITSGLLILDHENRVVLANDSFADSMHLKPQDLQGLSIDKFEFHLSSERANDTRAANWFETVRDNDSEYPSVVSSDDDEKTFMVKSAPISGDDEDNRGLLICFEDVTQLKEKEAELETMLRELAVSREEISKQNVELRELATKDPLTNCFNRRAFFELVEKEWSRAKRHGHPVSCVMLDIDHFKAINDNHGHSAGDDVLRKVGATMAYTLRDGDIICRFGGEEFCMLLPHTDEDQSLIAGERLRVAVEEIVLDNGLKVTASLGTSCTTFGAQQPQDIIEQADQALYHAKRNGRNKVTSFGSLNTEAMKTAKENKPLPRSAPQNESKIPFHAVAALISALGFRDADTADHSRRVADYCVATASRLMSISDCYILEIAALLHDIGKIGVPDAILLKPGKLTKEEWAVMSQHDRIGVEIVASAFHCDELSETIRTHHAHYAQDSRHQDLPRGKDIPLGARILTIADAYDAITSDRCYRKGASPEEAYIELRRCAGTQFDPDIVEVFIEVLTELNQTQSPSSLSVSKQTALRIGEQIERIANAADQSNKKSLHALAGRLKLTARREGVEEIADLSERIEFAMNEDGEMAEILEMTNELLHLCRETQQAFLEKTRLVKRPVK